MIHIIALPQINILKVHIFIIAHFFINVNNTYAYLPYKALYFTICKYLLNP